MTPVNNRSDAWQQKEQALSIVHVAGLELITEIKADGERTVRECDPLEV